MGRTKKIVVEEVEEVVVEEVQNGANITFHIDPTHELNVLPSLND
jgi:hypothetical protein